MNAVATRPKRLKAETQAARQMFLYGDGDGVRVLDLEDLSNRSGCPVTTLRGWLGKWEGEYEEMVKSSTKLSNAGPQNILSLPSEVLDSHAEDNKFLRKRLDKAKFELEKLPQLIEQLSLMIAESAADPEKIQEMFSLLDKYLRLSMNEKSLTRLFIDLKKLWDEKVGLDAIKAIQISHAKAMKGAATEEKPSPASENLSVFKR